MSRGMEPAAARMKGRVAAQGLEGRCTTCTITLLDAAPKVAVITELTERLLRLMAKPAMVKLAAVDPWGTTTLAGTEAVRLELDRVTTVSTAAGEASDTVPVAVPPALIVAALTVRDDSGTGCTTITT